MAFHVSVSGKPSGVIVDTAKSNFRWAIRLPAGHNCLARSALFNRVDVVGNVDQYPMKKVNAGEVGWDSFSCLIDVFSTGRDVWIAADECKGLRPLGSIFPTQGWTDIGAQRKGAVATGLTKGIFCGNAPAMSPSIDM